MPLILNDVEVRVLGCLMEKQRTTPDYYPLTLNALTNACNQLSNRDPVVSYEEKTVVRALDMLRDKKLVWVVSAAGSRVPKYEQRLTDTLELKESEAAALCLLMLRGPQTTGEIRARSGRLYPFQSVEEIDSVFEGLSNRNEPLVAPLPRQPGTRETRFTHLFSGEVQWTPSVAEPRLEAATLEVRREEERFAELETQVRELRARFEELAEQFAKFKRQFE